MSHPRSFLLLAALTLTGVGAVPLSAQETNPSSAKINFLSDNAGLGGYENTYPDIESDADDITTSLGSTPDGSPVLMIDVFKAMGNKQVKEASWVFKIPVAAWEATKAVPKDVGKNPFQWLAGGLIAWEAVDGGVSDLFDSGSDDSGRDIHIEGDGNLVKDVSPTATISIKGNANTVDANTQADTGLGP